MAQIFVNTDNSDAANKIYKATKMGKSAGAAEGAMKEAVETIIGKAADFTTSKSADAKGYTIRISVANVEKVGADTKYTLSGEIVRYPTTASKAGGKGEEMVSLAPMKPSFVAQGVSESTIIDTIESVVEGMVTKMLPVMRMDMARR